MRTTEDRFFEVTRHNPLPAERALAKWTSQTKRHRRSSQSWRAAIRSRGWSAFVQSAHGSGWVTKPLERRASTEVTRSARLEP